MEKTLKKSEEIEIEIMQKKISPLVEAANRIEITGPAMMEVAAEALSNLNKFSDRINEEKEKITKPLNEALKVERTRWKPLETIYSEAVNILRMKMTDYQTQAVKEQKEEEAKIAARVGDGKGKLKVETAIAKIEALDKPESKVKAASGSVKFKAIQKFEVMDVTLLLKEYILPNEVKIRGAMIAGIQIEGVRYYEEQVPFNSR